MTVRSRSTRESGVALITALLALTLVSALMAGMFAAIQADQRGGAIDRDQTQAYAAAHAGLEQLTSSLASLFTTDVSPSVAQISAIAATPPTIQGFEFKAPGGAAGSGYTVGFTDLVGITGAPPADGFPDAIPNADITTGPFTGFKGLITPYTMTVTARSSGGGSEVRLRRGLQTVAVPVFQFGMFSESDLSIYAGGGFNFGGRIHTNGNLFAASQTGSTITFADRITAVKEVVHNFLSNSLNNLTSAPSFTGPMLIPTSSSTNRNLQQAPNEGSVTGMPGPTQTLNPNWTTISTGIYKSYIRNGLTGAKRLDLPLVSQGAQPVDLIRRPALNSNEAVVNPLVYAQRFYSQASLRILLSDRPSDFAGLPTITPNPPVLLNAPDGAANNWTVLPPPGYGPVGPHPLGGIFPPIARSIGPAGAWTTSNGSQYAAPFAQVYVNAVPPQFLLPPLPPGPSAGQPGVIVRNAAAVDFNVPCQGKTGQTPVPGGAGGFAANLFVGCAIPALGVGPYQVWAIVDGVPVFRNVVNVNVGAGTITLANNDDTAAFSPNLFWMNHPGATVPGTAVPITCEGYFAPAANQRFFNCRGLTANPGNNLPISTSALAAQATGTIGGYIKIDRQNADNTWTDVTMEILNLGFGAPNSGGTVCGDPTPNAVIRIQRLRDNAGGACTYANSVNSYDWWPNGLYDAREGTFRDSAAGFPTNSPMNMAGVVQYISLDVNNLRRWLAGQIGATGTQALNNNGYIVYFSDRRGNHDPASISTVDAETGEFGWEDFVNPTTANGVADNVLQLGEDVNVGDPRYPIDTQQTYGAIPWNNTAVDGTGHIPTGAIAPYSFGGARPQTVIPLGNTLAGPGAGAARVNKVLLFRRALKLVNGGMVAGVSNLPAAGLTVAAENPVYVQGNYNATVAPLPNATWSNQASVPAAVIADAIALLSNNWSDARSFERPHLMRDTGGGTGRPALTTAYRFAAMGGKSLSFPYCGAPCGNPGQLFGTDGGAANFLRMLEDWNPSAFGQQATWYRGSLISLHINRQATGTYKFAAGNNSIYNAGSRNFTFDVNFLTPALLPPGTPMFRDVNTLQFRQILRPNQ
mgnify:CR=1 FL=1